MHVRRWICNFIKEITVLMIIPQVIDWLIRFSKDIADHDDGFFVPWLAISHTQVTPFNFYMRNLVRLTYSLTLVGYFLEKELLPSATKNSPKCAPPHLISFTGPHILRWIIQQVINQPKEINTPAVMWSQIEKKSRKINWLAKNYSLVSGKIPADKNFEFRYAVAIELVSQIKCHVI